MKIQCSGCEVAEAKVLCCADEAALCLNCDEKIHAVNKLASKHQRVPLSSSSSPPPKCDICQETSGYFFCLEDRALLCRKCDFSIHKVNSYVSSHQRFLLTGVKAGLAAAETNGPSKEKLTSAENIAAHKSIERACNKNPVTDLSAIAKSSCDGEVEGTNLVTTHKQLSYGTASENVVERRVNGSANLTGSLENNSYAPDRLSKVVQQGSAESEWFKILRSAEEELLNGDQWAASEDFSWRVPQLFSTYPVLSSHSPGDARDVLLLPEGSTAENFNDQGEPISKKRKSRRRCRS